MKMNYPERNSLHAEEPQTDNMLSKELCLCLVCGSTDTQPKNKKSDYFNYSGNSEKEHTGISQQLYIVFTLRKVLQVPSDNLEKYLEEFGNPTNWKISLCCQCTQLINQAKDLHLLILVTTSKLKNVQKKIVDKAKLQNGQSSSPDNRVYQETRDFVQNHNYDDYFRKDPLLEGNQLIRKLMDETTLSTKVKIEVDSPEEPADDNFHTENPNSPCFPPDNLDDDDWEPPPSPKPKRSLRKRKSRSRTSADHKPPQVRKIQPRQCPKCPLRFRLVTTLFHHLQKIHSTNQLPCFHPNCSKILTNQNEFIHHQNKHEKPLKCEKCNAGFINPQTYHRHMIDKHSDQQEEKLEEKEEADLDDDPDKYKDKKYACDQCNFRDNSVPTLFKHFGKEHPDKEGMKCPFDENCVKPIEGAVQWHIHKKIHAEKVQVTCHLCGMVVTRKNLRKHTARKHPDDFKEEDGGSKGLIRCVVAGCTGLFFKKEGLEKHLRKMHGGRGEDDKVVVQVRYSCSYCGRGFFQNRDLVRHELIHKNKESRPFICELCGKGFVTGGHLYEHKKYKHYKTSKKLLKCKKFLREKEGEEVVDKEEVKADV